MNNLFGRFHISPFGTTLDQEIARRRNELDKEYEKRLKQYDKTTGITGEGIERLILLLRQLSEKNRIA